MESRRSPIGSLGAECCGSFKLVRRAEIFLVCSAPRNRSMHAIDAGFSPKRGKMWLQSRPGTQTA